MFCIESTGVVFTDGALLDICCVLDSVIAGCFHCWLYTVPCSLIWTDVSWSLIAVLPQETFVYNGHLVLDMSLQMPPSIAVSISSGVANKVMMKMNLE